MAINFNKIVPFITEKLPLSTVATIILDCLIIDQKLAHPEEQSWYFKAGILGQQQRLKKLEAHYEEMREHFNTTNRDGWMEYIAIHKEKALNIRKESNGYLSQIQLIAIDMSEGLVRYGEEMLALKARLQELRPFREYRDYPQELELILEVG